MKVDLNSDLGEAFGGYKMSHDHQIIMHISSANIACGYHAGDPLVMDATVSHCIDKAVAVGAHPGFPDLMGFGRRNMHVTPAEAKAYIKYQVGALWAFATSHNIKIQHVKPHGALYNMAATDIVLSTAIAEGIYEINPNLIFLGLSGSCMIDAGKAVGLVTASEVFADRAYNNNGTLVSRSVAGSVIHDTYECIERTMTMIKEGYVKSIDGKNVEIAADSICVHGDTPKAVEFVAEIRRVFSENDIEIKNLAEVMGV